MSLVNIVGYAATFTGISFLLPQVWLMYRTKSVEDISWGTIVLFTLNCILWLWYGILRPAFPVALVNGIALMVCLVQLSLKYRYRNNP